MVNLVYAIIMICTQHLLWFFLKTLGKIVSLPQPFVALVAMDSVPGMGNILLRGNI